MSKKKNKKREAKFPSSPPGSPPPRQKEPPRPSRKRWEAKGTLPGAIPLFFSALFAVPALIYFFFPWYEREGQILKGTDLILRYDTLPSLMQEAFDLLGGEFFGYILLSLPLFALFASILYPFVFYRFKNIFRWVLIVLSFSHFWAGLILMLILFHQERIAYVSFGGYALFFLLFLMAGFEFLTLFSLDKSEGIREEGIPAWQWGVWFSAVFLSTLIHYFYVCYSLIEPAPKALLEHLRGRFRL